jgi:DNA adenine methylase
MANLPHPVQYQGSKRNLVAHILNFLPSRVERLVEPFAGTAAISIAAATEQSTQNFWLNDPPYQGVCGNRDSRYFSGIDFEEFV